MTRKAETSLSRRFDGPLCTAQASGQSQRRVQPPCHAPRQANRSPTAGQVAGWVNVLRGECQVAARKKDAHRSIVPARHCLRQSGAVLGGHRSNFAVVEFHISPNTKFCNYVMANIAQKIPRPNHQAIMFVPREQHSRQKVAINAICFGVYCLPHHSANDSQRSPIMR